MQLKPASHLLPRSKRKQEEYEEARGLRENYIIKRKQEEQGQTKEKEERRGVRGINGEERGNKSKRIQEE